jgi:hypothetical protein
MRPNYQATRRPPDASATRLETVNWDSKTFQLPRKLIHSTQSAAEKNQFLTQTLAGVRASNAAASTKLAILESRFDYPALLNEVNASLKAILDLTVDQESPRISFDDNGIFSLHEPSLRGTTAKDLTIAAAGQDLSEGTLKNGYFYSFQVTVNARNAYDGDATVARDANLDEEVFNVTTRLKRIADDNGVLRLHPLFTSDVLRNPRNTLQVLVDITGSPPIFGTLKRPAQAVQADLEHIDFRTSYTKFHSTCRYKIYAVLIRKEYLGSALLTTGSLQLQLQDVHQMAIDPVTKLPAAQTVDQYYNRFQAVVVMFGTATPFPLDIPHAFFANASTSLRKQADSMTYKFPPAATNETAQQSLDRLRQVKSDLQGFEKQLNQLFSQLKGHVGPRTSGNRHTGAPRAFPAYMPVEYEDDNAYQFDPGPGMSYYQHSTHAFTDPHGYAFTDPHEYPHPSTMSHDALLFHTSVMLSAAEQAIQNATGSGNGFGPIECWGCTHHPVHHKDRFHRWTECERRGDPQAQVNARKGLNEFFQSRKDYVDRKQASTPYLATNPYRPTPIPAATTHAAFSANWKEHGFPSQKMLATVCTLADPNIPPCVRKSLFKTLKHDEPTPSLSHANPTYGEAATTPTRKIARFGTSNPHGVVNLHFVPLLAPTYKAPSIEDILASEIDDSDELPGLVPRQDDDDLGRPHPIPFMQSQLLVPPRQGGVTLSISQQMPHIRIKVGWNNDASLFAMIDTGAGLSLGRLSYHADIFKKRPHLVSSFVYLKDDPDMPEFDIGGVDQYGNTTRVTAVIVYITPFRVNGSSVTLSIGLSASASTNTIIGLPFLRAAEAALIMSPRDDESMVAQKLGVTFKIEYAVPLRADTTPMLDPDTHAAYATFPAQVDTPAMITESFSAIRTLLAPITEALCTPLASNEDDLEQNKSVHFETDDEWLMHVDFPDLQ